MCTKPTVWVSRAFSVPYTVLWAWVHSALFAVFSFGVFKACIVCTLVNHCVTIVLFCAASPFYLYNSFAAHQSICCQSAVSGWSYLFAVRTFELWWVSASVSLTPIAPQQCFLTRTRFVQSAATCHRVLKVCLWLSLWDYLDLSYNCW